MTEPSLTSSAVVVDSSQAISAFAKEKIRMQTPRYQRGSLTTMKRKSLPDAWYFRYYTEEHGKRIYKRRFIGTVIEFPSRKDAEKAVMQLRVNANEGAAFAPMNIEQLAAHYLSNEVLDKSYSTGKGYKQIIKQQIVPQWASHNLASIKAIEVENWLRHLKKANHEPLSPGSKAKIRNVMSAMFSHAIRYGWAAQNPITAVRTSSKRMKDPEMLTPAEFQALLQELEQRERVMVLLDGITGLRRSELFGLKWVDIDFKRELVNVTHAVVDNVDGATKTAASRKPVPLPKVVLEELKAWRRESFYRSDGDYLFPSVQKNGAQPVRPDMILKRHIRPALERLGINKSIGWHGFRHMFSNLLRECGADVKTAQDLLRHANSRITQDIYQRTVTDERRAAQAAAFNVLVGKSSHRTSRNQKGRKKEEVKLVID
jgi:integrase